MRSSQTSSSTRRRHDSSRDDVKAIDSGGLHAIFAAFDLEEEGQVASIDEELAAKQAQTVISTLSPFASNPDIVATLRNAKDKAARAMTSFPSERLLNE